MIIFGTKDYTRLLATLLLLCPKCQQTVAHRVFDRLTRLTIFFIPLFRISTKHLVTCTYCGHTAKLTADESEDFVRTAAQAAGAPTIGPTG